MRLRASPHRLPYNLLETSERRFSFEELKVGMHTYSRKWFMAAIFAAVVGQLGCSGASAEPESLPAAPIRPGQMISGGKFAVINPAESGTKEIDVSSVLRTKPMVFYYWIAGNQRADEIFVDLQNLVSGLGADKIALFGVATPRPGRDAESIASRARELDIKVPILNDKDFVIGRRFQVQTVPNITLVDREGKLRLTNGAALVQGLEYEMDIAAAIRRLAENGNLVTYGYLERYYPVKEMEGKASPDFSAALISDAAKKNWSELIDDSKVNVLIFWSVDCPHCRESLPEYSAWLKDNPDHVNVFSAANVNNEATKIKTAEFCRDNNLSFRTLIDEGAHIGELFRITSTPTILIIGPDGVIDSAITSGQISFGETIEQKKQQLL